MNNDLLVNERKNRIVNKLSRIYSIPVFPSSVHEVKMLLDDPKVTASRLSKVINKDIGLVTKILTIANSPFYGIPNRVGSIQYAIILLGFEQIKSIIAALSIWASLNKLDEDEIDTEAFQRHSILTAHLSMKIADDLGIKNSGELFTAGLLHDLGVGIMCKYFPEEYMMIREGISKVRKLDGMEEDFLGITHGEIAAVLLERWRFPKSLVNVVKHHHTLSGSAEMQKAQAVVHLADYAASQFGGETFEWEGRMSIRTEIVGILQLGDERYLHTFLDSYRKYCEHILTDISIIS